MEDTALALDGLHGKIAIVTGAAQGIGAAVVERLLDEGCQVVGVDLAAPSRECPGFLPLAADVTQESGWAAIAAAAIGRFGGVDLLVNNAGILGRSAPLQDLPIAWFDEVFAVNARGMLLGMREVVRHLLAAGRGGAIVNVASIGAWRINPKRLPYAISKAAVMAMTQGAAIDLGRHGIRVNAVAPGITDTPMSDLVDQTRLLPAGQGAVSNRPIPRKGRPAEIASAIAWLLSEEASYVTGSIQVVDGGTMPSW